MSISQAFDTFTELLVESSGLDDKAMLELEHHFRDIWHEEYYSDYSLNVDEIKESGISPIHSEVYEPPYPEKFENDKTIIAVVDPHKNKGLILDGTHRYNTAVKEKSLENFKVIIFYVEIPWI